MQQLQNAFSRFKQLFSRNHRSTGDTRRYLETDKPWLELQFHPNEQILKPHELEKLMEWPDSTFEERQLDQFQGALIGLAVGDALGAHVEFRPREYLVENPVQTLEGGGTWGLEKGQFTDDTSMALCLGISLVTRRNFVPYDQLVRYKWWYTSGYMSSVGYCFDIGAVTRQSIDKFIRRQKAFAKKYRISKKILDHLSDDRLLQKFDVNCSTSDAAGNGALMRLAPVPLFFYKYPESAVEYSGISGRITHGDVKAYDACRYYGALIVAALQGCTKNELLDKKFYKNHRSWFGQKELCPEVLEIAEGSFKKKNGYEDGIRGKGYIIATLEAALWAFWSDENSFKKGVLAAVNLGDDTDTTAAIYGQLAGAYYGYKKIPEEWSDDIYAKDFIINLSRWILYEGEKWKPTMGVSSYELCPVGFRKSRSTGDLTSEDAEDYFSDSPSSAAKKKGKAKSPAPSAKHRDRDAESKSTSKNLDRLSRRESNKF